MLTAADILALFDRIYDPGYLDPLKSPGPGYEVLQAYASVAERISLAVDRLDQGAHILDSFGGAKATGTVQFQRPNATGGAVTIKKGTVVTTTNGGRSFVTTNDLAFGAMALGPLSIGVVAVAPGFEYNVPGKVLALNGLDVMPGDIDTIKRLVEDPPYGDPTFTVSQQDPTSGGAPPMLDQLGLDRGIPRQTGESDAAYKARIRQLPDTVSPGAILRTLLKVAAPLNATFDFIETWRSDYQTAFDCPSPNLGTPTYQASIPSGLDTNLFVYDDPRAPYPPFRNRWLDEDDYRGAFIVTVPNIGAVADVGMAYDDTANSATDLFTPSSTPGVAGGTRAMSAFDVVPTTPVPQGGYDGFDLAKAAVYLGLFQLLDRIKAAGIAVEIELQGQ